MSELQRYQMEVAPPHEWGGGPRPVAAAKPNGKWVQYQDHAAALAERDAEIERLRRAVLAAHRTIDQLQGNEPCACTACRQARAALDGEGQS